MIVVLFFISGIYFLLMGSLLLGFRKQPKFQQKAIPHKTRFSILIPFRNEAENLPQLLKSISKLNYPKLLFEVVLINDGSEDLSEEIAQKFIAEKSISIRLLQNKRVSNSPKKDALTIGISQADLEWIVTTDADCNVPPDWLATLDEFIQKEKPVMVCGPIIYNSNDSLIEKFQLLDGLSLQTVTIGSFGLKDRKSTRLNSSHVRISYAVFCLKKKKKQNDSSLDLYTNDYPILTHHQLYTHPYCSELLFHHDRLQPPPHDDSE